MALKEKVLRIDKCLHCGEMLNYIMRDKYSKDIPDKNIYFMVAHHAPYTFKYCEACKLHTKQETIAWDMYEAETEEDDDEECDED